MVNIFSACGLKPVPILNNRIYIFQNQRVGFDRGFARRLRRRSCRLRKVCLKRLFFCLGFSSFWWQIFDGYKQGIVEKAHLLQESDVSLDVSHNNFDIVRVKLEDTLSILAKPRPFTGEEISVLHRLVLAKLDDSVVEASFEVVYFFDLVLFCGCLDGVGSEKQINRLNPFHSNLKNAINPRNQRHRILPKMLKILRQFLDHDVELFLEHGLDDELPIMGKEEETSRFTLRFSSFENCLIVKLWSQRLLDILVSDAI